MRKEIDMGTLWRVRYIPILFEYLPRVYYLNYPEQLPCWPRSSVGRAPVDLIGGRVVKPHWGQIFLGPWGLPHFLQKGSNPRGFGVSAVLPIIGTLTINLNSISLSRVLRGSITIYLRFFSHYIEMVLFR